jgi:hypothetical protein
MKFGREACKFCHSGVVSFQWNLIIPEFTPEWSREWHFPEWAGMEFCSNFVCLFVTNSLFVCMNDVYLATKHSHSLLPTHLARHHHHPFVTAHDGLNITITNGHHPHLSPMPTTTTPMQCHVTT